MADFTSDQLLTFRRRYLRDYVAGAEKLSTYNKAYGAEWISDADIQAIKADVERDRAEELARVAEAKYNERISGFDSDADAVTAGNDERLLATYRLVRAECRALMIADDALMRLYGDRARDLAKLWTDQIRVDRTFEQVRQGSLSGVRLVRR